MGGDIRFWQRSCDNDTAILDWRFFGLFGLYIMIFLLLGNLPFSFFWFLDSLSAFTAYAVSVFWNALSVPASSAGRYITIIDFPMEIILECTALQYLLVFAAGVLAFRSHSLLYRAAGLAAGFFAIFLFNILRIGIIGIVGHYSLQLFDFVHTYLWQGAFTLFVLIIWILWVNGRFRLTHSAFRKLVFLLLVSFISFVLIYQCLGYYTSFLAKTAGFVFSHNLFHIGLPDSSFAKGSIIMYVSGGQALGKVMSVHAFNAVLFFAVAALITPLSERIVFLKRIAIGSAAFLFLHVVLVIIDGVLAARMMNAALLISRNLDDNFSIRFINSQLPLEWFSSGITLIMPLMVLLFVIKVCPVPRKKATDTEK